MASEYFTLQGNDYEKGIIPKLFSLRALCPLRQNPTAFFRLMFSGKPEGTGRHSLTAPSVASLEHFK
jgi:hypothetical protein